jgi:hypothetical protein
VIVEEPRKARLRRQLLDRGRVLATLLADVLSGKANTSRIAALGITGKPGMRPEEKLRWALDLIEARRKLLDAGDDRFGRCEICEVDLGDSSIDELPWADRCQAHG